MTEDVTKRLEALIEEIKDLILSRLDRIEELTEEIKELEAENTKLEEQIKSVLSTLED